MAGRMLALAAVIVGLVLLVGWAMGRKGERRFEPVEDGTLAVDTFTGRMCMTVENPKKLGYIPYCWEIK